VGARMRGGFNRVARRQELRRNAAGGVGESGAWAWSDRRLHCRL